MLKRAAENRERKTGEKRARNGDFGRGVLKRPRPETAPTLGERAEKNPTDKGWVFKHWWSRRESNPRPQALYRQFYILSPVFSSFKLHHARRTGWISPSRLGFGTCPSDPDKHDFM